MSLLNPTKGQMTDRVAALELKLGKFRLAGKTTAHLQTEIQELRCYVDRESNEYYELYALHSKIWDCIEVIETSLTQYSDAYVAQTARIAQELNRARYAIIKKLDEKNGQYTGDEKL